MTVLGVDKLALFRRKYAAARKSLSKWESVVNEASWKNFAELKTSFGSADYVEGHTIFNVGGNKYRIIAVVGYTNQAVAIEDVLTHEQYDRGEWKT